MQEAPQPICCCCYSYSLRRWFHSQSSHEHTHKATPLCQHQPHPFHCHLLFCKIKTMEGWGIQSSRCHQSCQAALVMPPRQSDRISDTSQLLSRRRSQHEEGLNSPYLTEGLKPLRSWGVVGTCLVRQQQHLSLLYLLLLLPPQKLHSLPTPGHTLLIDKSQSSQTSGFLCTFSVLTARTASLRMW